jgi:hypothetical protein
MPTSDDVLFREAINARVASSTVRFVAVVDLWIGRINIRLESSVPGTAE